MQIIIEITYNLTIKVYLRVYQGFQRFKNLHLAIHNDY